MNNQKLSDVKVNDLKEFCDFVEAERMSPPAKSESHIMKMVRSDLCPPKPLVFGKFFITDAPIINFKIFLYIGKFCK